MLKKINKKKMIILLLILFIYIPLVFAAISYSSSDVVVDNTVTKGPIYLQEAIDEIDHVCSINHPKDYICKNNTPKCIRATTLHTETCTNSDTENYCQDAGYALNETITYGNTTTIPGVLTSGDAFDCDVNGDGVYDAATERFYYISDYYDTSSKSFNDKVAVLIYYSNTANGVASTTTVAYDCSNQNHNGPVSARDNLPTYAQWPNIRLYKETRQILTQRSETSTSTGTLPTNFNYGGYAARLLTEQELDHGCFFFNNRINIDGMGVLDICYFLFEKTKYADSSIVAEGSWMETPSTMVHGNCSRWIRAEYRIEDNILSGIKSHAGTRPVIDVLKSEISY